LRDDGLDRAADESRCLVRRHDDGNQLVVHQAPATSSNDVKAMAS
jgi:hypothetical protein